MQELCFVFIHCHAKDDKADFDTHTHTTHITSQSHYTDTYHTCSVCSLLLLLLLVVVLDSTLFSEKPLTPAPLLTHDPATPAAPSAQLDDVHGDVASALLQLISQHGSEGKPSSSDSQCLKETQPPSSYSSPGVLIFSQPERDANSANANAGAQYPRDQDLRFTLGSCGEDRQESES